MNYLAYLSAILFSVLTALKALDLLYRFQTKEYRFDRFMSLVREEGFFPVIYSPSLRFPGKTPRNLLASLIILFLALLIFGITFFFDFYLDFALLLIFPLTAFLFTSIAVALTSVPAAISHYLLIQRAKKKMDQLKTPSIAITGSFGKSSVKEFLYEILKTQFNVAKTLQNMNTDLGVAICALRYVNEKTNYYIAETGAYRLGEVRKACEIINPKYATVTAFGNQHLDLYGSKENLVKAESEPLDLLPDDGVAYVNYDMPEFEEITKDRKLKIVSFSRKTNEADIYANNVLTDEKGTKTVVYYKGKELDIETRLLGRHTIDNLLPRIAIALDLGVPEENIVKALREMKPLQHKLSVHRGINKSTILSDSYNSNVDGFLRAIQVAELFHHPKKFVVSRGIIELGWEKRNSYKRILEALNSSSLTLITTDDLFKHLDREGKVSLCKAEYDLIMYLKKVLNPDTLLVVEGRFSPYFMNRIYSEEKGIEDED